MEPAVEILKRIATEHTKTHQSSEQSYKCPICKDVGVVPVVRDGVERWKNCECTIRKINMERIKKSGMEKTLDIFTFDTYKSTEKWQKDIKSKAVEYAKNPKEWFFIGGQSGAGKTHLCTAVCGELIKQAYNVYYMTWVDENIILKSLRKNADEYAERMNKWKTAKVLYIDDLFKTKDDVPVTGADVMTAYELINYRYLQSDLITIISSERSINELMDIDTATGGRIYEKSKNNMFFLQGQEKNYRIK